MSDDNDNNDNPFETDDGALQLIFDDDSDEEEEQSLLFVAAHVALQRKDPHCREKLVWNDHVAKLNRDGPFGFHNGCRMHHPAFMKLCNLIEPEVIKICKFAPNHEGVMTVEVALHCTIRWLSGGSWFDIRDVVGISKSSFCHCCHRCIQAINQCEALSFKFPETPVEVAKAAAGFRKISSHGVMEGCVGAMDGLLVKIRTPKSKEVAHVKSFHSGHCKHCGINVQAICDANCRFSAVSAAAPGGTNDCAAIKETTLPEKINSLPLTAFIVGDNAHTCTEHLLTPFKGTNKNDHSKDCFNCHLSQCRIGIECAFGRLVGKWCIFRRPLQTSLDNAVRITCCASGLHNCCIDNGDVLPVRNEEALQVLPPQHCHTAGGRPSETQSVLRTQILNMVELKALGRPAHNVRRNDS